MRRDRGWWRDLGPVGAPGNPEQGLTQERTSSESRVPSMLSIPIGQRHRFCRPHWEGRGRDEGVRARRTNDLMADKTEPPM